MSAPLPLHVDGDVAACDAAARRLADLAEATRGTATCLARQRSGLDAGVFAGAAAGAFVAAADALTGPTAALAEHLAALALGLRDLARSLAEVETRLPGLLAGEAQALAAIVAGSIRIKAAVVAADEREANLRAILNFGHTFGHAIEAGLGYGQWLHGEAVGCGMVMAADLSRRLGSLTADEEARLLSLIRAADLPVQGPGWAASRYLSLMETDKKAERGAPRFVVLDGLGRARMQAVDEALVVAAIEAHKGEPAATGAAA